MSKIRNQLLIGKQMKDFRKSKNLTSRAFAKILGVTPAYISQIEVERVGVSGTLLLIIKKIYPDTDMNLFFEEERNGEQQTP